MVDKTEIFLVINEITWDKLEIQRHKNTIPWPVEAKKETLSKKEKYLILDILSRLSSEASQSENIMMSFQSIPISGNDTLNFLISFFLAVDLMLIE